MNTIVGNLEKRLAAYAEEQKKRKPRATQPKRYRDGPQLEKQAQEGR